MKVVWVVVVALMLGCGKSRGSRSGGMAGVSGDAGPQAGSTGPGTGGASGGAFGGSGPPDAQLPTLDVDAPTSIPDALGPSDLARDTASGDRKTDTAADLTPDLAPDAAVAPPDAPLASDLRAPVTPAFHLTLPLSSSTVTTRTPTVGWTDPGGIFYFIIELCRDVACTNVVDRNFSSLTTHTPDSPLPEGVIYWRAKAMLATGEGPVTGTNELFIGPQTPHDTSMLSIPDFNRDGLADLALATAGGETIVSYLAPGTSGPIEMRSQVLPGPTRALAYGIDVNSDGYGDLLQARGDAVEVFYGSNTVLMRVATLTGGAGFGASLAGVGDVNGDGFGDVVIGSQPAGGTATAALHLSGRAGLAGPSGAPLAAGRFGGATDVNADGYADVVACSPVTAQVHFYAGARGGLVASGMLADPRGSGSGSFGNGCRGVGDVNGDGFGDVVVTGAGTDLLAFVYLGGEQGLTTAPTTISLGGAAGQSADGLRVAGAGDTNRDGFGDVLLTAGGSVKLFLGSQSGLTGTAAATATGDYQLATGVGDVNGDRYLDVLVVPGSCDRAVQVLPGSLGGLLGIPLYTLRSTTPVCPSPLLAH